MNIQQEIINAIDVMIQKRLDKLNLGTDVATVVTEVRDNRYKVLINGQDLWVTDAIGCSPSVGTGVWVRIPSGKNLTSAFIEGLRSQKKGSGLVELWSGSVGSDSTITLSDSYKNYDAILATTQTGGWYATRLFPSDLVAKSNSSSIRMICQCYTCSSNQYGCFYQTSDNQLYLYNFAGSVYFTKFQGINY